MNISSTDFSWMPMTRSGRTSVWLEAACLAMFVINIPVNLYIVQAHPEQETPALYLAFVLFMLACGVAGGIIGALAVAKQKERSGLVWVSILFGLFILLILLNELWQGVQYLTGR